MTILYISEFSEENIDIGKAIQRHDSSARCALWKNKALVKSKTDFQSVMSNSSLDNFFVIDKSPFEEIFPFFVKSFIDSCIFSPDQIVVRGELSEVWSFPVIRESSFSDTELYLVLDYAKLPLEDFEKRTLDGFDHICSMGPSSYLSNYTSKTSRVFETFESKYFSNIPDYLIDINIKDLDTTLVLCNSNNFNELSSKKFEKKEKISYVNVEDCPPEELGIYLVISKNIVDETNLSEFELILKKMGKEFYSMKEFLNKGNDDKDWGIQSKYLEEFANTIVKIITDNFYSGKGNEIVGSEIIIDG